MQYWLLKSEPGAWSWHDQMTHHVTKWDGVRNYQARNNLRAMHVGDLCFFYHSAIKVPAIVGIVRVTKPFEDDMNDPPFGFVTVEAVGPVNIPLSLSAIKANDSLANLPLIKQSRLSVMPIKDTEWSFIMELTQTSSHIV